MSKNRLVTISDVHIGSNFRTNWYQSLIHEPYLLSILNYVRDNCASISELVILGDLFDQWTYPADVEPPSFTDIVKANENLFGDVIFGGSKTGALADTLSALEGKITYINGNHDMSISPEDIKRLTNGRYKINTAGGLLYEPECGLGKIICTHGHLFSLFNAPDPANSQAEWNGIPLGYFMARLASHWTAKKLDSDYATGSTTADMPDGGTPSGPGFDREAISGCVKEALSGNDYLSALVMGAQLDAAGFDKNGYIKLPDNNKVRASDIEGIYRKLLHTYPSAPGIPEQFYGSNPPLFALTEADIKNSLAHFSKEIGEKYRLVLMGHTHVQENEDEHFVLHKNSLYANSGFCCPSKPDMGLEGKKPERVRYPSFIETVIDGEKTEFTVSIKAVIKSGNEYIIKPYPGLKDISISF